MKPEVQSCYDAYKGKSRPEILAIQRRWTSLAPEHKAACVLLDEMDEEERKRQEDRHGEEMTAAAVANHLARKALAVGVGAMILALIAIVQQCQGGPQ
jgi:hypothetical protein